MFRRHVHFQSSFLTSVALVALGLGILGWLSPQIWRFQGDLPITPQSLLMVLWAVLWGWQVGTLTVLLYLVAGGLGAPVFAGGASGWSHFTGSTSGFLFAFPIAALVSGWLAEKVNRAKYGSSTLLLLLGQAIILVLGLTWQRGIVPQSLSWSSQFLAVLPALLVKTALGTLVVVFVGRMVTGHRSVSEEHVD